MGLRDKIRSVVKDRFSAERIEGKVSNAIKERLPDINVTQALKTSSGLRKENLERIGTIYKLMALDRTRVEEIESLRFKLAEMAKMHERQAKAMDAQAEQLEAYSALDADAYAPADGIITMGRNKAYLLDENFMQAWEKAKVANSEGWPAGVPDISWRAHIAVWAARRGLEVEGDFVECGVHTGLLSVTICHALDFNKTGRKFFLFDTFNGIETEGLEAEEVERVEAANKSVYTDVFDVAKRNFADFKNCVLVQGMLPASLKKKRLSKIAYLSVDLNNVSAERGVIEALWDRVSPGGIVLIDDYDFTSCELQREMWDDFANKQNKMIACLPTGQGLLVK